MNIVLERILLPASGIAGRLVFLVGVLMLGLLTVFFASLAFAEEPVFASDSKLLPRTGQISCFNAQGQPVDYRQSGQDCEFQRGEPWPDPRFLVNDDGTITDLMTNLVWLRDAGCLGPMNWVAAQEIAGRFQQNPAQFECKNYPGGLAEWRLPTAKEFVKIFDLEVGVQADHLKAEGFIEPNAGTYWTATRRPGLINAMVVDLQSGLMHSSNRLQEHNVILVREQTRSKQLSAEPSAESIHDASAPEEAPAQDSDLGSVKRRFIVNNDGTVTDRLTGLMWLQDPACFQESTWSEALGSVQRFNEKSREQQCKGYTGTYTDWAIPNYFETLSLLDFSHDFPALGEDNPFGMPLRKYWSSSTQVADPESAYVVDFYAGKSENADKANEKIGIWPVRLVAGTVTNAKHIDLLALADKNRLDVGADFLPVAKEFQKPLDWPPTDRFSDNGDGTIMDMLSGIIWLKDASCFDKLSLDDAGEILKKFNRDPRGFECTEYAIHHEGWVVPSLDDLLFILKDAGNNPIEWLTDQGVAEVQGGGDYWTSSETPINLYYAFVVNLKTKEVRNYPKTFRFFVWPRRELLPDIAKQPPLPSITANAQTVNLQLDSDESLSLALYLYNFGITQPADFWVYLDGPEGRFWLTTYRKWEKKSRPIYQGPLFNLKNYQVFQSEPDGQLPAGQYTLHFAIDMKMDGIFDPVNNFSAQINLDISSEEDQP